MDALGDPRSAVADKPVSWLADLLRQRRPLVMGVLNVTPDSFSDGGRYVDPKLAIGHAERMIADGADIIDIGAESTRPYGGAKPVSVDEELTRLTPMLPAVVRLKVPVSIDSMKAKIAAWALEQGARMVNDVWGLQRDPAMADIASRHGVPVVIMHNRETADAAIDVIAEVDAFFRRSLALAERAGIGRDCLVLDPGIGFGKTPDQSIACIARLAEFKRFGLPLLIGASRKRFINAVSPSSPEERLGGSIASHLAAVRNGAAIVRTHDVAETVQALRVAGAIEAAR